MTTDLTTLDPRAGYVTIINTYTVSPDRADALLDLIVRATLETIRFVPGFVSANIHVNSDRTQVVNYAQWKSREAIAAARENPDVVARMREVKSAPRMDCGGSFHRFGVPDLVCVNCHAVRTFQRREEAPYLFATAI